MPSVTQFVMDVKLKAGLPLTTPQITVPEILTLGNNELVSEIVPAVQAAKVDYLTFRETINLSSSQSRYLLPERALGRKLRDITLIDQNGSVITDVPLLTLKESDIYSNRVGLTRDGIGVSIEGATLVVSPTPANVAGRSLRIRYYVRPVPMTALTDALPTTSESNARLVVSATTTTITLSAAPPASWLQSSVDVLQNRGAHTYVVCQNRVTAIGGSVITLATAIEPTLISANDHVYSATDGSPISFIGGPPIVPVPDELYMATVESTVAAIHEVLGRDDKVATARAIRDSKLERAIRLLSPVIDGAELRLVNRYSPLRNGSR